MEHLVRFTTSEGRDAQHVASSLDDALRFVERLRNAEEASAVRVYRLQEVPIAFKTYYRVELRGEAEEREAAPVAGDVRTPASPAAVAAPADATETVEQPGRKLFSRP